jgi:hypothetical protein
MKDSLPVYFLALSPSLVSWKMASDKPSEGSGREFDIANRQEIDLHDNPGTCSAVHGSGDTAIYCIWTQVDCFHFFLSRLTSCVNASTSFDRERRDGRTREIEKVGKDLESLRSQLANVGKEIEEDAAEREKLSMSEAKAKEEAMKLKEKEKVLRTEVQALLSEGGGLDAGRRRLESKRRKLEDDEVQHAGRRKRLVETKQARTNAEAGLERMQEEFTSKRRRLEHFLCLD